MIGVCFRTGPRVDGTFSEAAQGVAFRWFGADGAPMGSAVSVVEDIERVTDCAVAYYQGTFVVIWGQYRADPLDGPEPSTLWARRIRPRLDL